MQASLEAQKEWTRAVVFDEQGNVQASKGSPVPGGDIKAMLSAFNDKDTTVGNGFNIGSRNYEVHKFYKDDGLIYGRTHSVNPQDGEGICLAQVTRGTTKAKVFILITYVFPILSAKAVPDLQSWAKEWIENQ